MRGKLATRTQYLTDSLPLLISARAKKMIREGADVINLSVGEPDFPSPRAVKDAGIQAIENDFTRYTPSVGIPDLRAAIAKTLANDHALDYTPEQIIVTNGAKQAIASTLLALVEPDDEVIHQVPCYASYVDLIRLAGGIPVALETRMDEGYAVSTARLEKLIGPKTKAVILNNPNNPTGAALSPEQVEEIGRFLAERDVWLISDEIYEKLRYDGVRHRSFASVPEIKGRIALINGVSKYFSMTGWRIGFLAAPLELAKTVGKIQSQLTGSPCSVSQQAALEAYRGAPPEPDRMVEAFRRRRDMIVELMRVIPGVSFHLPQGAFYVFADVADFFGKSNNGVVIEGSVDLCNYLLEIHLLAVIPGAAFGMEGFVRFSFAASEAEIREGVQRFAKGLQALA